MGTSKFNAGSIPAIDQHPVQGGVEILLVASCYRNQDKLWPDGPFGSYTDLTFFNRNSAIKIILWEKKSVLIQKSV